MEFTEHPRPQTGQQQRMTSQGGNMQTIRFFYASSAIAFAAALVTAPANAQDAVPAGAGAAMPATGIEDIEIGRASCRERVCQYVSILVVAVSFKKKND